MRGQPLWAGHKTRVHTSAGKTPAFFIGGDMRELSVFVDESGDFGTYDPKSPFYIIGMVFHDQHHDIKEKISKLEKELSNIRWVARTCRYI